MSSVQDDDIGRMLEEMRADYWRNLENSESEQQTAGDDYLVVRIGSGRYGLPAHACQEVLKQPPLIRVPRLPQHLPGIFNLRGEIVAVTDLASFLDQNPATGNRGSRLVIVEACGLKTALLVDGVEGLMFVPEARIEALAQGVAAEARDLVRGKLADQQGFLILLDIKQLMQRPELTVDQKAGEISSPEQ